MEPIKEETIYQGPRFTIKRGDFPVDRTREWVHVDDVAAVVVYDETSLYLVKQPREAVRRDDILEIPAGLIDDAEEPLEAAQRELREETGLEADAWEHATSFYSSCGFTDELIHLFLATGLTKVAEPDADGHEQIELVAWPLDDLDGLIDVNLDAKTLVGALWLRRATATGR